MFPILPLLALIGGAAMQYKASSDASSRAKRETQRAIQRQDEYNRQAEHKALDNARQYTTDNRQQDQSQIQQQIEKDLMAPVESANQINAQTSTTQGDVSDDYIKAKAQSELNLKNTIANTARLMSTVTSAHRQRENESVRMADISNQIGRLGNFAQGQSRIDDMAVRQAAQPDSGLMLAGSLLQGAGMAGLAGGFSGVGETAGAEGALAKAGAQAPIISLYPNKSLGPAITDDFNYFKSGPIQLK